MFGTHIEAVPSGKDSVVQVRAWPRYVCTGSWS